MKKKNIAITSWLVTSSLLLSSCAAYHKEAVKAPTNQELAEARTIKPRQALQQGVFHMQRVSTAPTVLVAPRIKLKRPDLPPFEVAYVNRDVESILLELANASGESVVIPSGLRNRRVTLMHSGANFEQMLGLELSKVGYSYNYDNGIWYVTRYPVRSYMLEVGQSNRKGSLISDTEIDPAAAAENSQTNNNNSNNSDQEDQKLDTLYNDEVWGQVNDTLTDLVQVGRLPTVTQASVPPGQGMAPAPNAAADNAPGVPLLSPPNLDGSADNGGTVTPQQTLAPTPVTAPETALALAPEEDANPWFRVTKSASLITVRAAPEAHKLIESYLEQVQAAAHKQVMVDIRIVAVTRDKNTRQGLNMTSQVGKELVDNFGFKGINPVKTTPAGLTGGYLIGDAFDGDLDFVIQNLANIGDVYTLSSPSLLARNNQISRVSATRQLGYVETQVETTTTASGDVAISSRNDKAKFQNVGTVVSALPYIGKNNVQMRFRLSLSDKSGDVPITTQVGTDAGASVTNNVPEIATNIIDQDMMMDYGKVYAIGGIVESNTTIDDTYVPGISNMPVLRDIIRDANNRKRDTEFVVFIKVSRA
jgi:type II secretory pathway component GspD/PulD (secretin)